MPNSNKDLSQEEFDIIARELKNIKLMIKEKAQLRKKQELELRLKAEKRVAIMKENLLKEARELGCSFPEDVDKETIRRAIHFAKKNKNKI